MEHVLQNPGFRDIIFGIANNMHWCISKLIYRYFTPITNFKTTAAIVTHFVILRNKQDFLNIYNML